MANHIKLYFILWTLCLWHLHEYFLLLLSELKCFDESDVQLLGPRNWLQRKHLAAHRSYYLLLCPQVPVIFTLSMILKLTLAFSATIFWLQFREELQQRQNNWSLVGILSKLALNMLLVWGRGGGRLAFSKIQALCYHSSNPKYDPIMQVIVGPQTSITNWNLSLEHNLHLINFCRQGQQKIDKSSSVASLSFLDQMAHAVMVLSWLHHSHHQDWNLHKIIVFLLLLNLNGVPVVFHE